MLSTSAEGVVVGATDPEATCAFLGAFGFSEESRRDVPDRDAAAIYGLGHTTSEIQLGTAGADRPHVWVVACDLPGRLPVDYERGPRSLDVHTSDMDAALDHLAFVGLGAGQICTLSVGPVTMRQCLVAGPDGLAVVLVESSHRRPSLLDSEPDRLFSEGHSVVWCVPDLDAEAGLLAGAGLTKGMDLAFSEPEVSAYLVLPRSPVPIRMTMLSDEAVAPLRLELLEFPEDGAPADRNDVGPPAELSGGPWAMRFGVDDVAAVAEDLAGRGCRVEGAVDAAAVLTTPGGVRVQLVR